MGWESKKGSASESRKDPRKEGSAGSRGSNAKKGKAKEESIIGAQSQNVDSKKSKSGAGVELYRAAAPGSCVPLNYGQSRSSAFGCHGQYSDESTLKGPCHSLEANSGQRLQDSEFQISPQYADSQSPSDLEENFAFSIEEVPLAFGGLSKLQGSPIDPSQCSAAVSILGTGSQYYLPDLEFSATAPSSSGRDMAGKSQWSEPSTHETPQRSASNADPSFQVHNNKYFAPGCLINLTWFDDSEMGLKDGEEISDEEFLRRRRARKGTPRMFMLFRTFPNYSMAVPVQTYSREELSKPAYSPQHHAIIYSGKRIPPLQAGEKRPGNPPIRVETTEELPTSSRLNYAAVFTIEHTFPLAFVGKISLSDWEAFADSYAAVQRKTTGYDVQPPSADPEVGSDFPDPESPPFCDDIDPPAISSTIQPHQPYITTGYAYVASDPKRSHFSHGDYMSRETGPSTVQVFQSPTSPGSDASATSTSSSNGRYPTQEGTSTSSGSWLGSFGSEAPLSPFHAVNSTSKKTEVGQKGYSPNSVNYAQNGLQALRLSKPLVESFISPEQTAANKSMKWINDATDLRCNMMLSVQQGRSVRSLCSPSNSPSSTFVPSRVKVAILDSAANVYGPYFNHCIHRVKGFYDFIGDGQSTPEVTHGVHVASLLMHMAPDIDLYFARVLDGRDAILGAELLTKAIKYAIKVWKVDIISISGGMHEHDYDLEDALALARRRRVAVFAATHNHGKNKQMAFPARDLTVIAVSSCDPEGNLSRSAALAKEGKTNFSALGEKIPPFWMANKSCPVPRPLSGSSFAAPIVVGVYATTLLAARLSFRNDADAKLREGFTSHAVRERLMLVLSMKDESSKYHSLTPELLWNEEEGWTAAQIKHHIDHVLKGLVYH